MSKRTPDTAVDEYLVIQSQGGDIDAFGRLVERWHARFLGHALRYTGEPEAAKDIAQEGWMAIARGLGSLSDPGRFRSWAYRIVANKARDWVRREQSRRRMKHRVSRDVEDGARDGSTDAVERVRDGIARLDADQRLILTWFYMEEMSIREIAVALSVPPGTVKSRLYHARRALRNCVEEEK